MRMTACSLMVKLCAAGLLMVCGGCFTGVEGTKKIELSRQEVRRSEPTAEDRLISEVSAQKAEDWRQGKKFLVTDNRAALMFDSRTLPANPINLNLAGKTLRFTGFSNQKTAAGEEEKIIVFTDGEREYLYPTGSTSGNGKALPLSDELPMMVDKEMIGHINALLQGRTLWTRTQLWYDSSGKVKHGKKYIPVTVDSVTAGDNAFPLKIWFTGKEDNSDSKGTLYITIGATRANSRPFGSQFALADMRRDYPDIEDSVWTLIQEGKIKEGMTKEECRLSLGSPLDVVQGHNTGNLYDIWQYSDGLYLIFQDGVLIRNK